MKERLKLTWIPERCCAISNTGHYDLHTDEKKPFNVACIVTDSEGIKVLRKMVKDYNGKP